MSKPYAWVSLPENEIQILPFPDDGKTLVAGDGFYLYTHPVKQLSDEEIMKIHDSFGNGYISYLDFAKAIIKEIIE